MSFGLGISFGRLCRRKRSLGEIYEGAARIHGWHHGETVIIPTNLELRAEMIRSLSKTLDEKRRTYEKV